MSIEYFKYVQQIVDTFGNEKEVGNWECTVDIFLIKTKKPFNILSQGADNFQ